MTSSKLKSFDLHEYLHAFCHPVYTISNPNAIERELAFMIIKIRWKRASTVQQNEFEKFLE